MVVYHQEFQAPFVFLMTIQTLRILAILGIFTAPLHLVNANATAKPITHSATVISGCTSKSDCANQTAEANASNSITRGRPIPGKSLQNQDSHQELLADK